MTSVVDVCNLALGAIRAGSINSIDEPSLQAQQCKLHYSLLRDQCLQDAPWGFSHVVEPLAVLSSTEYDLFNWVYTYQYPVDCLHINRLIMNYEANSSTESARYYENNLPVPNLRNQIPYDTYIISGNRVLGANQSSLRASYRKRITDVNLFSVQFTLALSQLLAANIAIPIAGVTDGRAMKSDALGMYQGYINNAAAADLNERYEPTPDSEFISIRS